MKTKDAIQLIVGYTCAALTAAVIIWAMLALYQPTFDAVNAATENN